MMRNNWKLVLFTLLLALLATACKFRFGPDLDWSGFSPVIAIALFAGMMVPKRNYSFLLPLIALLLSDLFIHLLFVAGAFPYAGFYSGQWLTYFFLLSCTAIGWLLKGKNVATLFAGAIAAPTLFFLLSNFSVWASQEVMYEKSFAGLMQCYTAGLPFYKNALMATIIFLPVIVILYNFLLVKKAKLTLAA